MNKFKIKIPQPLLIILLVALLLSGCGKDPESAEAKVRNTMEQMEAAIEARNNADLFDHISDSYRDHRGNNTDALRKFARLYMFRHKNIELFTTIKSLEKIDENTFAVEANVVMGAQSEGRGAGLGQLRADSHAVSAVFILEEDDWKLSSLSWPEQRAY